MTSAATPAATPAATRRHPIDRAIRGESSAARPALRRRGVSSPFDQFAKDVLDAMLSEHGRVETEVEAPALASQRADVLFDPDPTHAEALRATGLLGRMSERCCLYDPFHEAPDVPGVRGCLRKLLNHQHARGLGRRPAAERSWLLCGGRPDAAIAALRMRPMKGWPRGFYGLGDALPLAVVVVSELPVTDETLPLRLMGAGATLRRALEDLARMSPGPPRDALVKRVVQLHAARRRSGATTADESVTEEDEMRRMLLAEQLEQEWLAQGVVQGRLQAVARVVERRMGRGLTDGERGVLQTRLAADGDHALDEALDLDGPALVAWLARAPG